MYKFLRFFTLVAIFCFAGNAFADQKVGYVEVERILKEAPQIAEIGKKLESEFSSRTAELTKLQKQIKDQESSGTAKEQDLNNLKYEFDRKQRELNEDVNNRKNEELASFQDKVNKVVTSIADSEGYDLVLYNGIAYFSKRIDMTDKVLKALAKPAQ